MFGTSCDRRVAIADTAWRFHRHLRATKYDSLQRSASVSLANCPEQARRLRYLRVLPACHPERNEGPHNGSSDHTNVDCVALECCVRSLAVGACPEQTK